MKEMNNFGPSPVDRDGQVLEFSPGNIPVLKYKVWKNFVPRKEDGPTIRKLWAILRYKDKVFGSNIRELHHERRRNLAHDYWQTKKL
jgi:hypothetical protein